MPLSEKQNKYLALVWQCMESEPKINYDKFATLAGLASAASARELMRVTKNKLKAEYGSLSAGLQSDNGNEGTPKKKTATPRKRNTASEKAAKAEEGDGDGEVGEEGEGGEEAPKKKAKKGGKGKGGEVEVEVKEDEFF